MITARRSQEFHELVEGTTMSGARAATVGPLLELVGAIRAVPAPVADPAFVARLRDRLLAEAATVLVSGAATAELDDRLRLRRTPPQQRRRNRRLAAAASGLVLAGATATMSVAARSALPGDGLYPLKRGIESAHAELTFNRADQGRVVLSSATTRLDEISGLNGDGADPTRIADTLGAFSSEAIAGSDLLVQDYQATGHESSITAVRTFTADSITRLRHLQDALPPGSGDQLLRAAQTLDQIQEVSVHSCASCAGPVVSRLPLVLQPSQHRSGHVLGSLLQIGRTGPAMGQHGPQSAPVLPNLDGPLPPASVTDPFRSVRSGIEIGTAVTQTEVQDPLNNLIDNLISGSQDTSSGHDTAGNLLDSVSQTGAGNTGNTVDTTIGGLVSQLIGISTNLPTSLPTILPTDLPTSLPTTLPTDLPTSLPTTLPTDLPTSVVTSAPSDLPSLP